MQKVVIFRAHESQMSFLESVLEDRLNDRGVERVEAVHISQQGSLVTVIIVGDTGE